MSEETIFTKIINGTIPSKTIYHDDLVTAFLDINPKAEHHILIYCFDEFLSPLVISATDTILESVWI